MTRLADLKKILADEILDHSYGLSRTGLSSQESVRMNEAEYLPNSPQYLTFFSCSGLGFSRILNLITSVTLEF